MPSSDPSAASVAKIIGGAVVILVLAVIGFTASYVVQPGFRGVLVTLGKVDANFKPEGFGFKPPLISDIRSVSIRQQTRELNAEAFSSDLQQIDIRMRVLFRIPEQSVVTIFQNFAGDPFDSLIAPRVQEALKEDTALKSAEEIVKQREAIKRKTLEGARAKVGNLLIVEDVVIENISLSRELATAIEAKMVQEQEAAKARFTQQKAEIDAQTAIIRARGEAEAIRIRGEALRQTPDLISLQIVEKWDGRAPLVLGGGSGATATSMILPLTIGEQQRANLPPAVAPRP